MIKNEFIFLIKVKLLNYGEMFEDNFFTNLSEILMIHKTALVYSRIES